ncbi:MAG TPA: hypothetical protein VLV86_14820 [Vicinamibacterales bacterium]|nr:hypothetical protein [Vicinamibacterales bacterium]
MLKLLERNVTSVSEHLTVLASPSAALPSAFGNIEVDSRRYNAVLGDLQRLRGSVYVDDGAISLADLTDDGRHDTAEDHKSWHLVMVDERRSIRGCIWYLEHSEPRFEELRVSRSPLAQDPRQAAQLRSAVEREIASARREGIGYAEVGGWAVSKDSQMTDCLLLILGTYALSQILGGAYVLATATVRHSSAAILRRLGGSPISGEGSDIASYFDPHYGCEMELLRFDTRYPARKFVGLVDLIKAGYGALPIFAKPGFANHNSASALKVA